MTKPADMTRDELLAEVDRLATLNNELSQILNRNADTLQASAQQIQRDAVRQTAAIVRERGGVMPEDLPEVEVRTDASGATTYADPAGAEYYVSPVPALVRERGLAMLSIARKIEENKT